MITLRTKRILVIVSFLISVLAIGTVLYFLFFRPLVEPLFVEEQEEKDEQEDESSKSLEQPISKKAFPTPKSPFKHATIKKDDKGSFFDDLHLFFDESDIAIQSETILKKNAEAEYILHVPSPIGSILFYCRAKGKKTLTEGDISTVFLAGQSKKLPILLLTNGSVSKKALAMLSNECQGMLVKNIYDGNTTN